MRAVRTVLDTNVLVSALVFPKGTLSRLRDAWRSGAILPLISRETVSELVRVLCYPKFRLTEEEREELLADYLPFCESVVVGDAQVVPECRDPFDRMFLELALAGRADVLITGDEDLLALASTFPVPIVLPKAFAEQVSG